MSTDAQGSVLPSLALDLAAHPRFEWTAGMLASKGPLHDHVVRLLGGVPFKPSDRVPELTDPATAGCLLAMLAECGPCEVLYRVRRETGLAWKVYTTEGDHGACNSPGEAIAEALLAAWKGAESPSGPIEDEHV